MAGRPDRVRSLFDAAIQLEVVERTAFLAEACGADDELLREVESLLEAASDPSTQVRRGLDQLGLATEDAGLPFPSAVQPALETALAGHYEIEREIGRGGMATVFLARDLKHDRNVAIKVLDPKHAALAASERFQHEIKVTARLQHPNILTLLDSGSAGDLPYYVMRSRLPASPQMAPS